MRVKICGLTTTAEVEAAIAAGATAVGILLTPSPQQRTPAQARLMVDVIPRGVEAIAVLEGDPDPALVAEVLNLGFDGVQTAAEPEGLRKARVYHLPHQVDGPDLLAKLGDPWRGTLVSGSLRGSVLVEWGGSLDAETQERLGEASGRHALVLGGALTEHNVQQAIRTFRPIGVDVRLRDPGEMRAFIAAALA